MIELKRCPKTYTKDQDKAASPAETVARVRAVLEGFGTDILAESKRIDTGRLGIPVFLSVTGPAARKIMPTRKQMGKGASAHQAEASALMELVERFSYFSFWDCRKNFTEASWSEAQALWPGKLMPVQQILKATGDSISPENALRILDLQRWAFYPATNISASKLEYVPLDLFKKMNEFNGSSAGNTQEESIFQGAAELVERHVCAVSARALPVLPTIDPASCTDEVLTTLLRCFTDNGIRVLLKDMTMGLPLPTVAALVYDPATFPDKSEIVYTAGTASSPAKAAIRALTEIAQLGGDFETGANYEASGLPKYTAVEQFEGLTHGPVVPLSSLPSAEDADILREVRGLTDGLAHLGFSLYSVDTTSDELGLPANYNFVPGFQFRERTEKTSLGLVVGRMLAEEAPLPEAEAGLKVLAEVYPDAHFLPFHRALMVLRTGDMQGAAELFALAEPLQDNEEDQGLAAFYQAYALTQAGDFVGALPHLDRSIRLSDEVKEYFNLRGVARFKAKDFEGAAEDFSAALNLDSGSAMDLANLGMCYKFLGKREEALHCLANALELDESLDFARKHLEEMIGA